MEFDVNKLAADLRDFAYKNPRISALIVATIIVLAILRVAIGYDGWVASGLLGP